jgi:hypothetical protein
MSQPNAAGITKMLVDFHEFNALMPGFTLYLGVFQPLVSAPLREYRDGYTIVRHRRLMRMIFGFYADSIISLIDQLLLDPNSVVFNAASNIVP